MSLKTRVEALATRVAAEIQAVRAEKANVSHTHDSTVFGVDVATTTNITLSGTQTIDGYSAAAGAVVLVKNQTTQPQNGIYIVAAGAWTRHPAYNSSANLAGAVVRIKNGTLFGGATYTTTFDAADTLGTTAMTWWPLMDQLASDVRYVNESTLPTQAEAETGTGDTTPRGWSGERIAQAIAARGKPFAVKVASVGANITRSISAPATIDGISVTDGDLVLLRHQTNPIENGIYVVNTANTTWTRHSNWDAAAEVTGGIVRVMEGTINGGRNFRCEYHTGVGTFGSVAQVWSSMGPEPGDMKFSGAASPEPGWLECVGTSLLVADYPRLFAVIGYTFGGSGPNFYLPNLGAHMPLGASGGYTRGSTGGQSAQTLTEANLPPHTHGGGSYTSQSSGGHGHTVMASPDDGSHQGTLRFGAFGTRVESTMAAINNNGAHTHNVTGQSGSGSGTSDSFSTMPPYTVGMWFIKT